MVENNLLPSESEELSDSDTKNTDDEQESEHTLALKKQEKIARLQRLRELRKKKK